jgi:hypothetical protein
MVIRRLRTARRATQIGVAKWEVRATVRQARRLRPGRPALRFCWDLDNTLVDSGKLLRAGGRLQDAIVDAEPVRNMLGFYQLTHEELPFAEHFILSARPRRMRKETLAWLRRHDVTPTPDAVWFVPFVRAKPRVWDQLARNATLVIIDDLSYDHESEDVRIYDDLVKAAEQTASIYIGFEEIMRIVEDSGAVDKFAQRIAALVTE